MKEFLNKLFIQRDPNFIVSKRDLTCILPYLGKVLFNLRTKLRPGYAGNLPYFKMKVCFWSKCRLTIY